MRVKFELKHELNGILNDKHFGKRIDIEGVSNAQKQNMAVEGRSNQHLLHFFNSLQQRF